MSIDLQYLETHMKNLNKEINSLETTVPSILKDFMPPSPVLCRQYNTDDTSVIALSAKLAVATKKEAC